MGTGASKPEQPIPESEKGTPEPESDPVYN